MRIKDIGRQEKGTSIIEVVIVAVMMSVILGAVLAIVETAMRNYLYQSHQIAAQDAVRLANMKLVRELRQSEEPLVWVTRSGGVEILVITADFDDNGTSEAVRYTVNRNRRRITREENAAGIPVFDNVPVEIICEDVDNTISENVFTYIGDDFFTELDPNTPGDDVLNKTRLIKVWLKVDKDVSKPPTSVDSETYIKLRNFAYK